MLNKPKELRVKKDLTYQNEKSKKGVYFLDNNEEVKIVTKTIPHKQIFIINKSGKIIVEDYFEHKSHFFNDEIKKRS